jgi:integrase
MTKTTARRPRRSFGKVRRLPSGRLQASYVDPLGVRHTAPQTFDTQMDADAWLADRYREIRNPEWAPKPEPKSNRMTFGTYAADWLADRPLKPRTRDLYDGYLTNHVLPTFADVEIAAIRVPDVKRWHAAMRTGNATKANVYSLFRTMLSDAVTDEIITNNPARIRGASTKTRERDLVMIEPAELALIAELIPPRYKALVLLGGWCGMRFGEIAALRRPDVDLRSGKLHIRRAVTARKGEKFESDPKAGSKRDVAIPPHVLPVLRAHLLAHAAPGRDGLVFPPAQRGTYLALSTLHVVFDHAAERAGRPDVRVHDLRHFGGIAATRAGATMGDVKARLGHKTMSAALRYQEAVSARPAEIAERMSRLAE